MRVAVVGAGVVGAITADVLVERGFDVTIVEAREQAATGATGANGGQLSYSFTDAMASPSLFWKLPRTLLGKDEGLRVRFQANLRFLSWGAKLLTNCSRDRYLSNSDQLFKIAMQSVERMSTYHQSFGCDYAAQRSGKLVLLSNELGRAEQLRLTAKQAQGCDVQLISGAQALAIEPALEAWSWQPKHAIYSPGDEVGDAQKFTQQLLLSLENQGVQVHYNRPVNGLQANSDGSFDVVADEPVGRFDAVVLCTGLAPRGLLDPLGIRLPIYPVTGYSVTLPSQRQSARVSLTALEHKVVFSRLADQVRIAGFADMNLTLAQQSKRQQQLLLLANKLAPEAADYSISDPSYWTGSRPMTPSSVPFTGPTKVPGLFLNLGHGMLGWTLAAGSASIVAVALADG